MGCLARVVVADLDRTLFNAQHTLSHQTCAVLGRLQKTRHVCVVFATGRPYPEVSEMMRRCGFSADYVISCNGARVHDRAGRAVAVHRLPSEVVQRLLAINVEAENGNTETTQVRTVSTNVFYGDAWVSNYRIAGLGKTYSAAFQPHIEPGLASSLDVGAAVADSSAAAPTQLPWLVDAHAVFFYGPHENLLPVERILRERFDVQVSFCFSLPHILEVAPKDIDKGSALRELLAMLGLSSADCIAFGDGMNDVAMLAEAGRGYVMSNASEAVRQAVPQCEVIGHHDEDGVAQKLCALYGIPM